MTQKPYQLPKGQELKYLYKGISIKDGTRALAGEGITSMSVRCGKHTIESANRFNPSQLEKDLISQVNEFGQRETVISSWTHDPHTAKTFARIESESMIIKVNVKELEKAGIKYIPVDYSKFGRTVSDYSGEQEVGVVGGVPSKLLEKISPSMLPNFGSNY